MAEKDIIIIGKSDAYKVIHAKTVKEIRISTRHKTGVYDVNPYTDRLKISKGWISYKRTTSVTKEEYSWSYKTDSQQYRSAFKTAVEELTSIINEPPRLMNTADCDGFNIRVTLNDDTKLELNGSRSFLANGLDKLSAAILKLLPKNELYPDILDDGCFHKRRLTMDILCHMDKSKLCALMCGGSMGSIGQVDIIDDENNLYTANLVYGDADFGWGDVFKLFDGYKEFPGEECCGLRWEKVNGDYWLYMYLGFGNNLLVKNSFFAKHGNKLFDINLGERYGNWKKLTK